MIYLSTGGFSKQTASETCLKISEAVQIDAFELSGGSVDPSFEESLLSLPKSLNLKVHNYFPPPKKPFVLNLASLNDEVSNQSMNHCCLAIDLAKKLGTNSYSFHAGFLLDPRVEELGKPITKERPFFDREAAKDKFISNVKALRSYSKSRGVKLYIENNVLSANNLKRFNGENPFLMADPLETYELMNTLKDDADLLIDVAHLKVSANSLGFSPEVMLEKNHEFINAYHLSDNNGLADENKGFDENAWFWGKLKKGLDYYSIEVYTDNLEYLKSQVDLATSNLL